MAAIAAEVGTGSPWEVDEIEPFDSERKWSAASFVGHGWFYLGAPDFLLRPDDPARGLVGELSTAGKRLLAVVTSPTGPVDGAIPADASTLAIVELEDEIRPDAAEILAYFAEQDVTLKVISGDNPETVAAIAERAGLRLVGEPVDARELPDEIGDMAAVLDAHTVFGRVKPQQKQAMVKALQSRGHTVAMTGDGVNDVLALKDADLGISMGSGSEATKAVADLVLTDNAFSSLPVVVNEGRKVINNVERVSNLFITKAAYAVLLTVAVGLMNEPFPFLPRHLTLIGTFSIGIPGFFLALAPEVDLIRPGFLRRVLWFSVPAGVVAGSSTLVAYEAALDVTDIDLDQARTLATVTLLGLGLVVLAVASRPCGCGRSCSWCAWAWATWWSSSCRGCATSSTRGVLEFGVVVLGGGGRDRRRGDRRHPPTHPPHPPAMSLSAAAALRPSHDGDRPERDLFAPTHRRSLSG